MQLHTKGSHIPSVQVPGRLPPLLPLRLLPVPRRPERIDILSLFRLQVLPTAQQLGRQVLRRLGQWTRKTYRCRDMVSFMRLFVNQ